MNPQSDSQAQPGWRKPTVDERNAHLKAGLDPRDLQYLAVNSDRRQPTRIKVGGRYISID